MQPADAAPAAAEPPTDASDATPVLGAAGNARPGAAPVPPPRSVPAQETVPAEVDDARRAVSGDAAPADAAPAATAAGLTEREQAILAFEQQWWRHAGAKEQAIRDAFGLSATRYYQLLNGLLDNPAALSAEPVLIGRLRRLRSSRARNRRR
ncbi:DUF3263 domain-containing protein [Micromonospora sp. NPDC048909]|uniref:DUF3263 domain-containing protein n=1 Tax=Micromonospora sp. NPDC048909 TaxID=3155643 RepID=UPI0033E914BD